MLTCGRIDAAAGITAHIIARLLLLVNDGNQLHIIMAIKKKRREK